MKTAQAGILLLVLALAGYFLARQFAGYSDVARQVSVDECDLGAGACVSELDGMRVAVSIGPRPIPLMQPLRVQVELDGAEYLPERLDITGLNMEMGLNRTVFEPGQGSRWVGETILPICSQRPMHWRAVLRLQGAGGPVELVYQFHTRRSG